MQRAPRRPSLNVLRTNSLTHGLSKIVAASPMCPTQDARGKMVDDDDEDEDGGGSGVKGGSPIEKQSSVRRQDSLPAGGSACSGDNTATHRALQQQQASTSAGTTQGGSSRSAGRAEGMHARGMLLSRGWCEGPSLSWMVVPRASCPLSSLIACFPSCRPPTVMCRVQSRPRPRRRSTTARTLRPPWCSRWSCRRSCTSS